MQIRPLEIRFLPILQTTQAFRHTSETCFVDGTERSKHCYKETITERHDYIDARWNSYNIKDVNDKKNMATVQLVWLVAVSIILSVLPIV